MAMASRPPLTLIIRPVPPFRLDFTVWALRRRPRNLIDRWDGSTYRRVIRISRRPMELAVRQVGSATEPRLIVKTVPAPRTAQERRRIRTVLDRLLGLRVDLTGWYCVAARDARLQALAQRFRGVKPPRFPTLFEALINAFACQQLSLEVGLELLNRLATIPGVKLGRDGHYAFPGPRAVIRLPAARYRAIGFSHQKVRAIRDLARTIARRDLDPESLDRDSEETIRQRLTALRGVGRWTAEYVLLRGLGRLNVFPGDDVGAQKRLANWLGRAHPLDDSGVQRAAARWHPYAGMVYFHLLLDGLVQRGVLEPAAKAAGRNRP
jgi:DNA-3-methyladenine glycosylase II